MTKKLIVLGRACMLFILMINASCNKDDELALNNSNFITSVKLTSGGFTKDFEVKDNQVNGVVPSTIDDFDIALTITISDKATITPDPKTITSIKNPINFTVTAENGEKRNYVVDIKRELSSENIIESIKLTSADFTKDFEIKDNEVNGVVPYTIDDLDITLVITISDKATITPDPSTITSIKEPVNFMVTAENGEKKNYVVDIKRELSPENTIVSFQIKTALFEANTDIDNETGTINQTVLPNTVLTSIETIAVISDRATISPDPKTISDYTNPVLYTVTAENGESKEYRVALQLMNEDFSVQCDIRNATKWFGGDDRVIPDYPEIGPRNVGTGQTINLKKDTYPTKFGFFLRDPFRSDLTNIIYSGDFEIKLNIRNADGRIEKSISTIVSGPFNGGWIDFDLSSLNIFLKKGKAYNFTWYLVDGERLGVSSGSSGNANSDSGVCGAIGWAGESREKDNTSLEDWGVWFDHPWHFNFRLEGKQ
ncbi:DUF5018 domain-containing protein [Aquimarina sediminis]|uniref:DUF5018 domain-containing protein n=1 Tax=Aquimarina sediminis TaxID=2070536 RepID=UPI000CA08784|nr:DUF5018 domain-containing protein [Aquimarina sediminis]